MAYVSLGERWGTLDHGPTKIILICHPEWTGIHLLTRRRTKATESSLVGSPESFRQVLESDTGYTSHRDPYPKVQ